MGAVARLVLFFFAVFVLLGILRQVPVVNAIFRVPFLGFWLTAVIVSVLAARGGAWLVDRRRQANLIRRFGTVDTPSNRGKLGSLLASQGRWRQALPHLEAAREGEPETAEWGYRLGQARLALGDARGAVEELERVVEADEEHAYGQAMMRLAEAWEATGESRTALETLERFERNHGPSPESAFRRGRAHAAVGDKDAARAAYAEVGELARTAARFQRQEGRAWAARALWAGLWL